MPERAIRIAVAQMETVTGKPSLNFERMKRMIEEAKAASAELVLFPAYCLGGTPSAAFGAHRGYLDEVSRLAEEVRKLSREIAIVFAERFALPRHEFWQNTSLEAGICVATHGSWAEIDDDGLCCLTFSDKELALGFGLDPISTEGTSGAPNMGEIAIRFSTLPWLVDSEYGRDSDEPRVAPCKPTIRLSMLGLEDRGSGLFVHEGASTFDSGSTPCSRLQCSPFSESLCVADYLVEHSRFRAVAHLEEPAPHDGDEMLLDALCFAISRFDSQMFGSGIPWIIGLSGGLDSTITAALFVLALGPERLRSYNLATRYNSKQTKDNAHMLAEKLGIGIANGSIEALVQATKNVAADYGYPRESLGGLIEENIQARLRGHLLSTFAALEGGVIINNGNKIECALGYATLYGDAIGALAPIADLTKTQLFGLASAINKRLDFEIVPANLLPIETEKGYVWETMPSAELKKAQKDPMKWFYHDWLIVELMRHGGDPRSIMEAYLEGKLQSSGLGKWLRFYELDKPDIFIEDLEWVLSQMSRSAFKRKQSPPGIILSANAFGFGLRENQLKYEQGERYESLRARILMQARH